MNFKIVTPEREVFADEITQVTMMTTMGEITVLQHHIPLVANLVPGEIKYKKGTEELSIAVSGGFAEVRPDGSVVVLADTAEHAHEIDLARAEAARDKAAKLMESAREKDDVNYAAMAAQMEKALARVRVGNKYRKLK
ncbi:MAG: ATP synthase F1 subunit epsilon [Candidatus Magasanikbacteria bacterium]|nr:ATP synthase F1 subunit epsilon [Candidatus Magasanikbacteria bacterium]